MPAPGIGLKGLGFGLLFDRLSAPIWRFTRNVLE